jgi:hypothetical protein
MAIVKRKDSAGRNYYINTTTGKRTTEASFNRSKSSAKIAKTQFKTKEDYACLRAASILGRKSGKKKNPVATAAGRKLRTCDTKKR